MATEIALAPNHTDRSQRVREYIKNLTDRFGEILFDNPQLLSRMRKFNPAFFDEFYMRLEELDERCAAYIKNEIDWEDFQIISSGANFNVPLLHVGRDIASCGRDLFCFVVLETKKVS